MKKAIVLGGVGAVLAAALVARVAWAVCGGISLAGTYPLGVDMAMDGWHYFDIPLSHSRNQLVVVGSVFSESSNHSAVEVKLDGQGPWLSIYGSTMQFFNVSAGRRTWNFRMQAQNYADKLMNVCVWICPSGERKRHFGVMGCIP